MATVETLYVAPKPESRALRRIRLLSLPFQIVFAGLGVLQLLLSVLVAIAFFVADGQGLRLHPEGVHLTLSYVPDRGFVSDPADWPPDSVGVGDLPFLSQAYGAVVLVLLTACTVGAYGCLFKLFGAYRRGVVFAGSAMAWMRRAGALLVVTAVAPGALQPLTQALGLRDSHWLDGGKIAALLVGGALFVLAYVIELGREIETESKGYV
jgi:hypothetical protein